MSNSSTSSSTESNTEKGKPKRQTRRNKHLFEQDPLQSEKLSNDNKNVKTIETGIVSKIDNNKHINNSVSSDEFKSDSESVEGLENKINNSDLNSKNNLQTQNIVSLKSESIKNNKIMASLLNCGIALKVIPEFDGSSAELHKFLTACDFIYEPLTTDNDQKTFLKLVTTKLSKQAYDFIKYKELTTWPDLKTDLVDFFSESQSLEALQVELVQMFQKKDENVKSFSNRVESTLSKLNDACIAREGVASATAIQNINKTTALKAFEDGLKNPIKLIIKACRFTDLVSATRKAIEEETSFHKKNFQSISNKTVCQFCKKNGHTADVCFSLKNKISNKPSNSNQHSVTQNSGKNNFSNSSQNSNSNSSQNSNSQSYPKNTFSNQNQQQNRSDPNQPPQQNRTQANSNNNNGQKSNFIRTYYSSCKYCHKRGHSIQNCTQRLKKELNEIKSLNENPNQNSENASPLGQNNQNTPVRVENL